MSYSRFDRDFVGLFAELVRKASEHDVQSDTAPLGGEECWEQTLRQIEAADVILVLLTPDYLASIYCAAELDRAVALNKPLLFLMRKPCTVPQHADSVASVALVDIADLTPAASVERCLAQIGAVHIRAPVLSAPVAAHQTRFPIPPTDQPAAAPEILLAANLAAEHAQFELAENLMRQVIVADPAGLGVNATEHLAEIRYVRQRAADYREVENALPDPPDARERWRKYVRSHGHSFDPKNFAAQLEFPNGASAAASVAFDGSGAGRWLPQPFAWCSVSGGTVKIPYGQWRRPRGEYMYIVERSQQFSVAAFEIARYPITNAQFQAFLDAPDGYCQVRWWRYSQDALLWRAVRSVPAATAFPGDDSPRTNVSWFDAVAFCHWFGWKTGDNILLPTEQQWQRAAHGDDYRAYAWGDEKPDENRCNFNNHIGHPTPVGRYPGGQSECGALDMCGNVWEWTLTKWHTAETDLTGDNLRTLRGGSWNHSMGSLRNSVRYRVYSLAGDIHIGFRPIRNPGRLP